MLLMCKYWYNNHHIEVNLESCDDVWSSHPKKSYKAKDEKSYDKLNKVVKVLGDELDAPVQ
jgi:hypothetical protein